MNTQQLTFYLVAQSLKKPPISSLSNTLINNIILSN